MAPDLIGRYAKLEKALKKLEKIRSQVTKEEFLLNDDLQDIVDRNLQTAIEAIIDISNHLISERGYRKPESSVDIFRILAEQKIIEVDFSKTLEDWVRFRNILIHDYADIDYEKVYSILTEELNDLRHIASVLADELKVGR